MRGRNTLCLGASNTSWPSVSNIKKTPKNTAERDLFASVVVIFSFWQSFIQNITISAFWARTTLLQIKWGKKEPIYRITGTILEKLPNEQTLVVLGGKALLSSRSAKSPNSTEFVPPELNYNNVYLLLWGHTTTTGNYNWKKPQNFG